MLLDLDVTGEIVMSNHFRSSRRSGSSVLLGDYSAVNVHCFGTRRGKRMPRLVIAHDVLDIDRWLKGKAERAAALRSAATDVNDFVPWIGVITSP